MNLLQHHPALPNVSEPRSALRAGIVAATCTLVGTVASGPFAQLVVATSHPQPSWQDARTFATHYHPVQALPFFLGFLLVAGFVLLVTSLHCLASARLRARTQSAVVFTAVFAALVLFNYAVQTTIVAALATRYEEASASLLAALTMANPISIGWSLEMWGYAWLGVATWLVAPVFDGLGVERAARATFTANGPLSVVGAFWTALQPGWVMTRAGLIAFAAWNALVIAMAVLALMAFRRRMRSRAECCATVDP
jgi:hypothetical protein